MGLFTAPPGQEDVQGQVSFPGKNLLERRGKSCPESLLASPLHPSSRTGSRASLEQPGLCKVSLHGRAGTGGASAPFQPKPSWAAVDNGLGKAERMSRFVSLLVGAPVLFPALLLPVLLLCDSVLKVSILPKGKKAFS